MNDSSPPPPVENFHYYDYLRFTFADIHGISRTKLVPRRHFDQHLEDGVFIFAGCVAVGTRCDLSLIDEVLKLNFGNCVVRHVPGTLHGLPWAAGGKYKVGEVLCESFWIKPYKDGGPQEGCPRYVARKQLERLKEAGYELLSAFEAEFMVFKNENMKPIITGMDVLSSLRHAEIEEFLCDVDKNIYESGIDATSCLIEHGLGQLEYSMTPSNGIKAADWMFSFKEAIRELALKKEWKATFMTQPFPNSSTTGLHFNHSLWSITDNKNVFDDPLKPGGLSDVTRHWVAGLIKHAKALTAFCCPTVNCYRRLFSPWTPEKTNWGIDDRFSAFRVKNYGSKSTHVESRLPSGAANSYLVLAATVAAGLDGIINRLECPPQRAEGHAGDELPRTLSEALKELQQDETMVAALGQDLVKWFVQIKKDLEIEVTAIDDPDCGWRWNKERELYFDLV